MINLILLGLSVISLSIVLFCFFLNSTSQYKLSRYEDELCRKGIWDSNFDTFYKCCDTVHEENVFVCKEVYSVINRLITGPLSWGFALIPYALNASAELFSQKYVNVTLLRRLFLHFSIFLFRLVKLNDEFL